MLTSRSPHLLTRHATRHPTWLRRGYATEASLAREVPGRGTALIPRIRTHEAHYNKSNLQREIRWLKDPLKLADHTVELLRGDDFEKALEIVRLASKYAGCTVSWNHLIDYKMNRAQFAVAVKLYNEVSFF